MAVRRDDRNPGKWMIELRINRGKPNEIRKIQRNIKTEKEAKLLENLFLNEIHGKELVEVDISFGDAIKDFLKKLKSRVKPATSYSREKCIEKYILCKTKPQVFRPVFDFKAPIAKVTTGQLDRWREKILEQDISDGHKNALIRIMRDIFKNAKKYAPIVIDFESVLESVVVNDVITEQPFYEYEEYLQFEAAIDDDEWKMFFQTLYYTGARIGELQALTFADLLPTKEIYIYKSITSAAKKSIKKTSKNAMLERRIGTPKNSRSIRRVLLPDFLYDKLLKYQEECKKTPHYSEENFIFFNQKANCLSKRAIYYRNHKYADMAGIKRINIHGFRHSHCSWLLKQNISSPTIIANRLGHSVKQTLDTYNHLFKSEQSELIAKINAISGENK